MKLHALDYAHHGLAVFPCRPDKSPYTTRGFKEATTDESQIENWWARWPDALIGLPCGQGFWVLDVDPKHGGDETLARLEAAHGNLPLTYRVRTPSGGTHYYFSGAFKTSAGTLGQGLDTRGAGGYVVAPPSVGAAGAYEILADAPFAAAPLWLRLLGAPQAVPQGTSLSDGETVPEGGRNRYLYRRACYFRKYGLGREEILGALLALNEAKCTPPLDGDELRVIADSAMRHEPDKTADESISAINEMGRLKEADRVFPPRADLAISNYEFENATLTPACLVEDYLYADVAQLIAPGGTGKTTMILYEAVHLALGKPLWGLDTPAPVGTLIVTKEDTRERLVARLARVCASLGLSAEERAAVMRRVWILDLTGHLGIRFAMMDGRQVVGTEVMSQLLDRYVLPGGGDVPLKLMVVDPMVSFGASESQVNDNEQGLIEAGRLAVRLASICVRFIHHTGKANAREHTLDQYSGRGGSAMADGSRMTTVLSPWVPDMPDVPTLPEGMEENREGQIMVLARPKLSYAPPNLPPIIIQRRGFTYMHEVYEAPADGGMSVLRSKVYQVILAEARDGRVHDTSHWVSQLGVLPSLNFKNQRAVKNVLADLTGRHQITVNAEGFLIPERIS